MNRNRLKGKAAVKYHIYDTVTEALKGCRSMEALKAALAARGIGMNTTLNAEGKPKGVVFTWRQRIFCRLSNRPFHDLCQALPKAGVG